jgi:hypothetical protein
MEKPLSRCYKCNSKISGNIFNTKLIIQEETVGGVGYIFAQTHRMCRTCALRIEELYELKV